MDDFWRGKRVLITGHTGFKGSWLSLWLQKLGADVSGYALLPEHETDLFVTARVASGMQSIIGDVLNAEHFETVLKKVKPEIVIHMAAQSLVRRSYHVPLETLAVNVMGTANVLQAARAVNGIKVIVNVTSDKCYENQEWPWGYRESDPMGGYDVYSCSKGCSELVTASYRRSFFSNENSPLIASVRAGNVIGGGDWAEDRIIPDCIRAILQKENIQVRNPHAVRPWQHVLEPLAGYLMLIKKLWQEGRIHAQGWNFGSENANAWPVSKLVRQVCNEWGPDAQWNSESASETLHEATYLKLDSSKARQILGWQPVLNAKEAIALTVDWYKRFYCGEDAQKIMLEHIEKYRKMQEVAKYE